MFLGFKIWNGKPPITQWYSFTFKKKKNCLQVRGKVLCEFALSADLHETVVVPLDKKYCPNWHHCLQSISAYLFPLLSWKRKWLFATGSIMIVCNRQYFSVVFTIRVLYDRSVWTPYKQHGTLSASCVRIASSPLVETSSTLRKENRTVRKVGIFLPLFIIFFADSLGLQCFCVAF